MPNWAPCELTIAAPTNDETEAIYDATTNDDGELDFERIDGDVGRLYHTV